MPTSPFRCCRTSGLYLPRPDAALKLVAAVPGLTLTLDCTHFTRAGLSDARVELMITHTSHIHIRGARKNRLQASFRDNVVDYRHVVRKLKHRK